MNKKKLIIVSHNSFAESYLRESVIPAKIKKLDLIINEKNSKIENLIKIKRIECKIHIKKQLTPNWIKRTFDIKNSLLISAGSTWIIKKDIIKLFKRNILNLHQSALPSLRGAIASYVKLFEIRALQTCLHVVTEKIDEGDIVFTKNIFVSKEYDTPLKISAFLQRNNRALLKDFLISYFIKKKKITYNKQNEFFSSYMPRLKSKINGWIDWSSNVYELERFIGAFGDPYPGAKTMIHGKQVSLLDAQLSCMEPSKHPFENGMVIRKFLDMITISVNGGSLYIKKVLIGKKNIINKIIPGDIFYTSINKLDSSKRKNIYVLKDKLIYNNKRNKIKKF